MTSLHRWLSVGLLMILLIGCTAPNAGPASQSSATPNAVPATPSAATPNGDALLQVIAPAGTTGFSLSDLQKLPATTITNDGKPQDGPAVLDVLKAANVTDFKEVTISGSGSITLPKDQVTREVILDFTNRGTVKFAATNVPKDSWPKDIVKIEVK